MRKSAILRVFDKPTGYVFENKKLVEVKWLETEFSYSHETDDCSVYNASTSYQRPDGSIGHLKDHSKAYESVADFENNTPAPQGSTKLSMCIKGSSYGDALRQIIKEHDVCDSNDGLAFWAFNDRTGKPEERKLSLDVVKYDYKTCRFSIAFPEESVYKSQQDVLSWNTYKVVGQDGTEHEKVGVNKLLMLDDDQRELLKQFEDICKKMNDADMLLIGDSCEDMSVFNLRHIKNYALDYNDVPDVMDGDPEDYERADRYGMPFKVNHHVQWWGDDNSLFILRKPTENGEK